MQDTLSIRSFAKQAAMSPTTVMHYIKQGRIKTVVRETRVLTPESLVEFLAWYNRRGDLERGALGWKKTRTKENLDMQSPPSYPTSTT